MAVIGPISATTRDGAPLVVRSAAAADAAALLALAHDIFETCDYTLTTRDEFTLTEEQERAFIEECANNPDGLFLLAEMDGKVVGSLVFRPEVRKRIAHTGSLGMGLASSHRGRGIGGPMLEVLLDWAAGHERLEKVWLGVFPANTRAIALYERLGFVEESRSRRHFKLGPGRYSDDIVMAVYVKPAVAPEGFLTWARGVGCANRASAAARDKPANGFLDRRVRLRDGSEIDIRHVRERDVAAGCEYMQRFFAEGTLVATSPGEPDLTPQAQRARFRGHFSHPRSPLIGAFTLDGAMIGMMDFQPGHRRRLAHVGEMGMGVDAAWRGRGVGRAMLVALLDWARAAPGVERMELGVLPANTAARALYAALGFVEEARLHSKFKFDDGTRSDKFVMAIYTKDGVAPEGFATWRGEPAAGAKGR